MTAALPTTRLTAGITARPISTANNPNAKLQIAQRGTLQATQFSTAESAVAAIPAILLAMGDTFAESLSFGLVGENDLENYLIEASPRFGQYFKQNRSTVGLIGDIAGAFIPGTIAVKAIRSTGRLGKLANKVLGKDAARFITSTGKSNQELFAKSFQEARLLSLKGVNNLKAPGLSFNSARKKAIGRSVADTVIETIAADMAIAASQYSSDFLFPDEMSLADHIAWGLGTTGIIGAGAGLIAKTSMRRGIQEAVRQGRGDIETITDILNTQVSGSMQGNRGTAIAARAFLLDEAQNRLSSAKAMGDNVSREAALREVTAIEQQLKDLTLSAFKDSPIADVTKSFPENAVSSAYIKAALAAYKTDPSMPLGLKSFEKFSREELISFNTRFNEVLNTTKVNKLLVNQDIKAVKGLIADSKSKVSKRDENKLRRLMNKQRKLQTEIDKMERTVPLIIEIDGSISTSSSRAAIFQDGTRKIANHQDNISSITLNNKDINVMADGKISITPEQKELKLEVNDLGQIVNPDLKALNANEWAKLSHMERTGIYDAMQTSIDKISGKLENWRGLSIKFDSHFTQIDFAIDLIKKNGNAAASKIDGMQSLEQLQFLSLKKKFNAFQKLRQQAANSTDSIYRDLDNVAKALNLPIDGHPLMFFFEKSQVIDDIIPLDAIVKDLSEIEMGIKDLFGIPQSTKLDTLKFSGSMLDLPHNRKPIIAVIENTEHRSASTTADLQERIYVERGAQATLLQNAKQAEMVQAVLGVVNGNKETVSIAKQEVRTLIEGNLAESDVLKDFWQQSFRFRDQDAFRAFDTITALSDKAVEKLTENLLKTKVRVNDEMSIKESFNKILLSEKRVDLDTFMNVRHSLGVGWDIAENAIKRVQGKSGETMYQFSLNTTSEKNKAIWRTMFDEDFPDAEAVLMPATGSRDAATLTQDGLDALQGMNILSQKLLINVNAVRRSRGMREIKGKPLHLPPPDFSKKQVAYLIDKSGSVKTVVSGNTDLQLRKLVEKEIEAAGKNGEQLSQVSEATVQRYYDARSEAFFEMTDYSKSVNQTGSATGKAFGEVVQTGPDAFRSMLESQLRQFSDVARETRVMVFDPEVQFLKLQRAKTGISNDEQTIFDDLISRIAGVSNLNANSFIGKLYGTVESLYDKTLQSAYNQLGGLKDIAPLSALNLRRAQKRADEIDIRFTKEHAPFKSMTDYMQRTDEFKLPVDLRKHAAALNEITTAITIRIMDVGMGVVNIVSLVATMPIVVAMLKQQRGESALDWKKRIGAFSATTAKDTTYFSPTKAVVDGIHFGFSKEGKAIAQEAADAGFLDQFAAEQIELFSRTGEQFLTGMLRNFSNKLSVITDKTERWSRGAAWMTFYNVGRKGIGLDKNAAMAFAHQQANNVIADFRPTNRPLIFQGAAGMPLGLFTTYMWNYLQRFVGLVETIGSGGGKPLALQVGLQSSLFGAESLPGWQQYTSMFMENYDGSHSPVDRLNEAFGPMGADIFLNGTVSNLPRLFGLSEDGISIGPRAGVGLPFQQGFSGQSIAGVRLMTRIGQTAGAIIDSTLENQGVDITHAAEILAASNINKGVSNLIELGVTNRSLDYKGNIIEPDVSLGANIATASRALGFRPLFSDELRQENRRNRTTDKVRAELKTRLSQTLRSKIRGGRITIADAESALESYVRAGGNPESFKRFFQSQIQRGTKSKVELELAKAIRNSADSARIGRLLLLSRD